LKALRRAVARDLGTLGSIKVNNIFLFVALLAYGAINTGLPPKSAYPFFVLLGFLLLFPLSSDPLGKIPPARMGLWPLTGGQRLGLRFASLALSPVTWIGVLILLKTARPLTAFAFCGLAAGVQAAAALGRHAARRDPHWNLLRLHTAIPRTPGWTGAQEYARDPQPDGPLCGAAIERRRRRCIACLAGIPIRKLLPSSACWWR
jgi:hypothetical protein